MIPISSGFKSLILYQITERDLIQVYAGQVFKTHGILLSKSMTGKALMHVLSISGR